MSALGCVLVVCVGNLLGGHIGPTLRLMLSISIPLYVTNYCRITAFYASLFLYCELELQATAWAVGDIDVAAVELHCVLHNGKTKAGTAHLA